MHERISIDFAVCHGRPVIRGTRVPVAVVVGSLAGGMSEEEVGREYDITVPDIHAALAYDVRRTVGAIQSDTRSTRNLDGDPHREQHQG